MNEFKKLNERFDRVQNKLDAQTTQLTHVIRDAQLTNYLTPLEATNAWYLRCLRRNKFFLLFQSVEEYASRQHYQHCRARGSDWTIL